jgi:ADP-ribose pyrophosphatase YjhB (NUDIX family)
VRELEEETGYQGELISLAFVHSFSRSSVPEEGFGPFHGIQIVYRMRVTGGGLRHEVDESTDQAGWFTLDEARDLPLVELAMLALDHAKAGDLALAD